MRLGTRGSDLARWQAEHVAQRLRQAGHPVEIVVFTTRGDILLDRPISEIGDKGLFTDELDRALVAGDIQLAVHSLKDLPTDLSDEIVLAAVTGREEPWDAFVAHSDFSGSMSELPEGAVLATSSLRRRAQLLAWRPDLRVVPVRGNVPTRLDKLDASGDPGQGGWHGLVLAAAGLVRLGEEQRITERIDIAVMLPAVGQGALGIVAARREEAVVDLLADVLADPRATATTAAERALLRRLEGGCQVPVGAYAAIDGDELYLEAAIASLDGSAVVRDSARGALADPGPLGTSLAEYLLERGGDRILAGIRPGGAP
jgi:hydroxymethylbilane synthase